MQGKVKSFDILWEFNKEFCDETLLVYDKNKDKTLNPNELAEVKKSLEEYLLQTQYLTYFYYTTPENNDTIEMIEFTPKSGEMEYKDNTITYRYTIKSDVEMKPNREYSIEFLDREMLFNFIMKEFTSDWKMKIIKAQNAISFTLNQEATLKAKESSSGVEVEEQQSGFMSYLSQQLSNLKKKIQKTLQDIQVDHSISAYIWLLAFSFLYGVVHAIGPGHGKSLVASYFLSGEGSVSKALSIAGMIGVVHTFSAFIFSFVIYYLIKGLLSTHFNNVEAIATKVSALIIITIALYLLYQKLQTVRKPKAKGFSVANKPNLLSNQPQPHVSSCGCSSCNTNSTDIGVVIGAGIIPCPGTVTIFIFTFSLGIYLVGFLSAIFMSLGMSLIIFLMAYLSIKVKQNTIEKSKAKVVIEYLSLVFILGLGVMLLIV
jgi:ABC-type nickel/cobalt efflux system permease component RcnA